ncbi:hypothetical protein [Dolichospermum sp. UHCC 0259]|uniref:hypothetical protein n=1 Tax=Dolichospermum sp. UHCC 0259 TaxID=2590010 RepID=UPI0014479C06|nr:hypothetical protein [Dolichospermum sp. UHCC 0259]
MEILVKLVRKIYRSQESGVRSQESGVRSQESGRNSFPTSGLSILILCVTDFQNYCGTVNTE